MRSSDSGFAHGTNGSPQGSFEAEEYSAKMAENEAALKKLARAPMIDEGLIEELEEKHMKFSREDMLFITRDSTGQIIWLESGNSSAGLEHIYKRHTNDFESKISVRKEDIPEYLHRVVTYGSVVENKTVTRHGRKGYSRKYRYNGRDYILTGIGLNGFLVSAYPVD